MVESDIIVKEIKCWQLVLTALAGLVTVESFSPNLFHIKCPYMSVNWLQCFCDAESPSSHF